MSGSVYIQLFIHNGPMLMRKRTKATSSNSGGRPVGGWR